MTGFGFDFSATDADLELFLFFECNLRRKLFFRSDDSVRFVVEDLFFRCREEFNCFFCFFFFIGFGSKNTSDLFALTGYKKQNFGSEFDVKL